MLESASSPIAARAAAAGAAADLELIRDYLAGESSALDQVRRWIRGALTPYRRSLASEIEDLEGEILLSLVETLRAGRFEGRSSFATYVRRTVLYRCINRLRDRRQRESVPIDEEAHVAADPSPESVAASAERMRLALRVLAEMAPACRELWAMLARGLDYLAMAERTGVAPGTLRVRMLRCRQAASAAWRTLTGEAR
jgi:RNA polymerase sigma factor (sigma-70 family)